LRVDRRLQFSSQPPSPEPFWLDPIKVYSGVRGQHTYVISHACSRHLERPDPVFKWYGYA
jgi:hypothetical protein